jgi:hypothetical protein
LYYISHGFYKQARFYLFLSLCTMHSLSASFVAAAPQTSSTYSEHGRNSRSRQALEAVDAYLRRDSTYLVADMPSAQQAIIQVSFLGKLLGYIR